MRKLSWAVILASGFAAPAAQAETRVILAYGDSLIAGYGLAQGDGFVPQLSRWLADQGIDAEVINGGVSGDTTAGGLARLGWAMGPEVEVVLLGLGGNDFLRGIDPASSRANLDAMLAQIEVAGLPVLLLGQRAAANYGADYARAFDEMYGALALAHGAELYPYFFDALLTGGDLSTARQVYFQRDGLHPNAAGVALIVADIGPHVINLLGTGKEAAGLP
ncbi:MAG: arylesterase [Rhodobacteraceae bacterium]|nr:arylesterase [Paracoccaceae bacterium]